MSSTAFAFTAGPGELADQSIFLAKSIREQMPASEAFCFIPTSDHLSPSQRDSLAQFATVVDGEMPIPGYPISAKHAALIEAAERTSAEYAVFLDSDTVLCNPLSIPRGTEIAAKPGDMVQFWTRAESRPEWERLVNKSDIVSSLGGPTVMTVDGTRSEYPYYNAGVVAVESESEFPEYWLDVTAEVIRNTTYDILNADQVALGMLSGGCDPHDDRFEITELGEAYNFPLPWRGFVPTETKVLHYHDIYQLDRVINPKIRSYISELGLYDSEYFDRSAATIGNHVYDVARAAWVRSGFQRRYGGLRP